MKNNTFDLRKFLNENKLFAEEIEDFEDNEVEDDEQEAGDVDVPDDGLSNEEIQRYLENWYIKEQGLNVGTSEYKNALTEIKYFKVKYYDEIAAGLIKDESVLIDAYTLHLKGAEGEKELERFFKELSEPFSQIGSTTEPSPEEEPETAQLPQDNTDNLLEPQDTSVDIGLIDPDTGMTFSQVSNYLKSTIDTYSYNNIDKVNIFLLNNEEFIEDGLITDLDVLDKVYSEYLEKNKINWTQLRANRQALQLDQPEPEVSSVEIIRKAVEKVERELPPEEPTEDTIVVKPQGTAPEPATESNPYYDWINYLDSLPPKQAVLQQFGKEIENHLLTYKKLDFKFTNTDHIEQIWKEADVIPFDLHMKYAIRGIEENGVASIRHDSGYRSVFKRFIEGFDEGKYREILFKDVNVDDIKLEPEIEPEAEPEAPASIDSSRTFYKELGRIQGIPFYESPNYDHATRMEYVGYSKDLVDVKDINASESIKHYIRGIEKLRLEASFDVNRRAVGYGANFDEQGNLWKSGDTIDLKRAESLLELNVSQIEKVIKSTVRVPLTQNEFDGLVDFTYNAGSGNLRRLIAKSGFNTNQDIEKLVEIMKSDHIYDSNGTKLKGLITRRNQEGLRMLLRNPRIEGASIEDLK